MPPLHWPTIAAVRTPDITAADYADDPRAEAAAAIAAAAKQLNDYREAWLNPPDWTMRVHEVVPVLRDKLDENERQSG